MQGQTKPFVMALLDTFRDASRNDMSASPAEVQLLLRMFAAAWASAGTRVPPTTKSSDLTEIATALQPAGTTGFRDPMEAAKAMYEDMVVLEAGPSADPTRYAETKRRYGSVAACGHAVLRVVELLQDRYDGGELDAVIAPFVTHLAPALLARRVPK